MFRLLTALTRVWFPALIVAVSLAASPAVRAADAAPVLLVVGDSLSAGYGLANGEGWVDLLQRKLEREGYPHRVVNASVTGDTTAGGRVRLAPLLERHRPAIVVIELGGNDGLRGGSLDAMRENLQAMAAAAREAKAQLLLVGVQLPPNYGPQYTRRFAEVFSEVARAHGARLVSSLIAGFGHRFDLFQGDRVHPTSAAQPRMLDNVWSELAPLLGKPRTALRR